MYGIASRSAGSFVSVCALRVCVSSKGLVPASGMVRRDRLAALLCLLAFCTSVVRAGFPSWPDLHARQ